MQWAVKYIAGRFALHDASCVHDYHRIGHFGYYAQIVAYKHNRYLRLCLKPLEQSKYL
jgi:hypothetical protein